MSHHSNCETLFTILCQTDLLNESQQHKKWDALSNSNSRMDNQRVQPLKLYVLQFSIYCSTLEQNYDLKYRDITLSPQKKLLFMTNHPSLVPTTSAGLCRPHGLWHQRLYMDQIPTFGNFPAHYSQFCSTAKILVTVIHSQIYPVCVSIFSPIARLSIVFIPVIFAVLCLGNPTRTHSPTNPVGAGSPIQRGRGSHIRGFTAVCVCCFQVCLHSHTQCTLAFSALSTLMQMGMCTIKAM